MTQPHKNPDGINPRRLRATQERAARNESSEAGSQQPERLSPEDIKGLGAVVIRNQFYKDGYRALLRLVLLQGIVILGLIMAIFFVIQTHQPKNRYFATTEDGRLVPMVSLDQPNLSAPALMSWVAQAATEV